MICLPNSDKNILETLRAFLLSTRGSLPVYIVLEQNGNKRTVETNFKIDATDEIINTLKSIVGNGAVSVIQ